MVFAQQSPYKLTYAELVKVLPMCGFPVRDIMKIAKGEEDAEFADEPLDYEYTNKMTRTAYSSPKVMKCCMDRTLLEMIRNFRHQRR